MKGQVSMEALKTQLKQILIHELRFEDIAPEAILDNEPLLREGLGLDSLDALQLAVAVEEEFNVRIRDDEEARDIFASIEALARYIVKERARETSLN
jgi:acyl carrier protein